MGAWSADNFGNDDAADWAYGLEETNDLSLVEWVERVRLRPSSDLVERARQALDRILGPNSELRELWEEAEESDEWARNVTGLRGRLQ